MHVKTDSEGTSLAPSSPAAARQAQPLYYVQSPSRDSRDDGDHKTVTTATTASFHSTPMGSPAPHSSSLAHHSRHSSSSTRYSASLKPPGSRSSKISPNHGDANGRGKPWKDCGVIEEEGLLEDQDSSGRALPRRCYFLAFLVAFFLLFSLFSLILWGVSKSQKPEIAMKSLKFESLTVQAGSDSTGVATDMISLNSTVKFTFHNTGTFFGVHVSSTPLDLSFNDITIASGSINKFYQSRKSERSVVVSVIGNKIPLYGSGASLRPSLTAASSAVAMKLSMEVRSRAYVLGKLVKPEFYTKTECSVSFDPKKQQSVSVVTHLKNCTYT